MKDIIRTKDLQDWITLQEPVVHTDEQGGHTSVWRSVHGCWARIEPVMPSLHDEAWHVGQHITACRYRIWIRGDFPVTPKMRVDWAGQHLTLLSAPVFLQRKAFQTFMTQLGG